MPTYINAETGEVNQTSAGSRHDRRRANDPEWVRDDAGDHGGAPRPAATAKKGVWEEYAASLGVDPTDLTKGDLQAVTQADDPIAAAATLRGGGDSAD